MNRLSASISHIQRDTSDTGAGNNSAAKADHDAVGVRFFKHRLKMSRSLVHKLAIIGALLPGVAVAYQWWDNSRTWATTDNAFVNARIHNISTRLAGTVQEVHVQEYQFVRQGDLIATLDPSDWQVRKQQAEAHLEKANAEAAAADAQVTQARAESVRLAAQAEKSKLDLSRARSLFEGSSGAISRQEYDQATANADISAAAVAGAEAAVAAALAHKAAAAAQQVVARANLQEAELQLSYTRIRTPVSGRVGRKNLETGNRVQSGQTLIGLVESEMWVSANYKETQVAKISPGQAARLKVDALPGVTFTGKVESVSPASGAQFALLPPDNATGNFTKIVQRVAVRIRFDEQSLGILADRIAAGMSVVAQVKVRE